MKVMTVYLGILIRLKNLEKLKYKTYLEEIYHGIYSGGAFQGSF